MQWKSFFRRKSDKSDNGLDKTQFRNLYNRWEAIKTALGFVKLNNIVIITGKGAEPWMCVKNGKKIPWDDRKIVREALKNKY
ncbi:MAG: hypothetical protein Q8O66_00530 [bacterium]|nr:hypothetical protein [bacterium]